MIRFEVKGQTCRITGATYPWRYMLRDFGAAWSKAKKRWTIPVSRAAALKRSLGAAVQETPLMTPPQTTFAMPDIPPGDWENWPTHWAGGSNDCQVDKQNVPWVQGTTHGEVCRISPRVPQGQRISTAKAISALHPLMWLAVRVANLSMTEPLNPGAQAQLIDAAAEALRKAGAPETAV